MQQVIRLKDFPGCQAVIDVIYNPFKTALLLEAEKLGLKYTNGLPMLVAQATAAAGILLRNAGSFSERKSAYHQIHEAADGQHRPHRHAGEPESLSSGSFWQN